jgi:hypothetical protein
VHSGKNQDDTVVNKKLINLNLKICSFAFAFAVASGPLCKCQPSCFAVSINSLANILALLATAVKNIC